MEILIFLTVFAGGYLIGSIPVAYLLVKSQSRQDLRRAGSSNIGAANAYTVTGSRALGLAVGLLDACKGILAWLYAALFLSTGIDPLILWAVGLTGAVIGHNYNLWLSISSGKMEGGKGLATAAGGVLFVMPHLLIVWGVLFALGRWLFSVWRGTPSVIAGNVLATTLIPMAAYLLERYRPTLLLVHTQATVQVPQEPDWRNTIHSSHGQRPRSQHPPTPVFRPGDKRPSDPVRPS
jgi:acyl-phosphate glycerol 3-phosphate acyltransferase